MMMGLMGDMGVTEITVDDFFNALIEALDNDKDVFEYQSDTYSHPFFGKMVSLSYHIVSEASIFFIVIPFLSLWMVSIP